MRYPGVAPTIVSFIVLTFSQRVVVADAPPMPSEEQPAGVETLTRGPVHEAFAEPITLQAEDGLIAPNEPPPNVAEYPPVDRPQGDRYLWVPGYWSWDGDRNDFIWVSACWRAAPPNTRWVPGYWTPVETGWEWVPGFWSTAGSRVIDYLPAPPAPVELEPPGPPPDTLTVWVPGCWYWTSGRAVLRHGYWLRAREGWVWVPSHWRWTPRGYVFVPGHWDYAFDQRGVLFAPVYFPRSVYARVGFSYSPNIVINISILIGNLFAYPRYSHYYFGDYYDDAYLRVGIYPQFEVDRRHTWYDPVFQYERWRNHRDDPRWEERQRDDYDRRRADRDLRPARTYREQVAREATLPEPRRKGMGLAVPIEKVVAAPSSPFRLQRITNETRQQFSRNGAKVEQYREKRSKWESPSARPATPPPARQLPPPEQRPPAEPRPSATTPSAVTPPAVPPRGVRATQPERVRVPPSPVVGRPVPQSDKMRKAPPPAPPAERLAPSKPPQKKDKPNS